MQDSTGPIYWPEFSELFFFHILFYKYVVTGIMAVGVSALSNWLSAVFFQPLFVLYAKRKVVRKKNLNQKAGNSAKCFQTVMVKFVISCDN